MDDTAAPALAAEALTAITGLFQDGPVTPTQGRLAKALAKTWRAGLAEFLDQKKPKPFRLPKAPDHEGMLDQLTAGVSATRRAALVSQLADPALGEAYLTVVARGIAYLKERWPVLSQDTPLGPRYLPPGKVESGRSASLLSVVDDPGRVLEEMNSGTLTTEQGAAFRSVYPELAAMARTILWQELVRRYKTPEKYSLAFAREQVIRKLVGMPPEVPLSRIEPAKASKAPAIPKVDFKDLRTKAQELGSR